MINISFEINSLEIGLGMGFARKELLDAEFEKLGFFAKMLLGRSIKETVYRANNCTGKCFNGNIVILPKSPSQNSTTTYGDLLALFMWKPESPSQNSTTAYGTSAYLFFRDNKLNRLTFQVIGNE